MKEIPIGLVNKMFYYKEGKLYKREDDKEVGWLCNGKYLVVDLDKNKYLVHRVIWAIHYGATDKIIDHIDQDKLNNSIENLRESNKTLNNLNSKLRAYNKSGMRGVTYCKRTGRYEVRHCGKFYGRFHLEEAKKIKQSLIDNINYDKP